MIGKLQGIVDYVGEDFIILTAGGGFPSDSGASAKPAGGVGYKVFVTNAFSVGCQVSLWVETIVREDSIRLFGFESLAQQELFNQLLGVSGVGPKVAMAILGAFEPKVLFDAIAVGDAKTLSAAPGLGKKTAEKIILDLKGKVMDKWTNGQTGIKTSICPSVRSSLADLLAALESLGYRRADIAEMSQKLARENPDADVQSLIKLALKEIKK